MKNNKIIFTVLAVLLCIGMGFAQTKGKKTTPKKKAAPAPVAVNEYVCTDPKDKLYHKRSSCAALNKCPGEIKLIKTSSELKKYKRKSCTRCHGK